MLVICTSTLDNSLTESPNANASPAVFLRPVNGKRNNSTTFFFI